MKNEYNKNCDCRCGSKNSFIAITAICSVMIVIIVTLFLIFSNENISDAVAISWSIVVLGVVLGAYQLRSLRNPKDESKKR